MCEVDVVASSFSSSSCHLLLSPSCLGSRRLEKKSLFEESPFFAQNEKGDWTEFAFLIAWDEYNKDQNRTTSFSQAQLKCIFMIGGRKASTYNRKLLPSFCFQSLLCHSSFHSTPFVWTSLKRGPSEYSHSIEWNDLASAVCLAQRGSNETRHSPTLGLLSSKSPRSLRHGCPHPSCSFYELDLSFLIPGRSGTIIEKGGLHPKN